jgi:hypothetical protein
MAAGATTGRPDPYCSGGGESSSFFSHVPEYIGSLIPPPGAAQGGESSVSAHAGTADAGGIGAAGSRFDAVSEEEGLGGDELGCNMEETMSQDFDGAAAPCAAGVQEGAGDDDDAPSQEFGGAAAPWATGVGVQEGAGDHDDAGIGKSSSRPKK